MKAESCPENMNYGRLQQKHFRSHYGEPMNWQWEGSIQSEQTLYNTLQK